MLPAESPALAPEHLNNTGCTIKVTADKGRGVYASRPIPRNTTIEISPVLLFNKEEYENHGKYTVLDHYTFKWPDSRMALALGLGSLFNRSDPPNVSYFRDTQTESIRYTTTRDIDTGEELCIYYGHNLWFSLGDNNSSLPEDKPEIDDGWGGLSCVDEINDQTVSNPYEDGDPEEIVPEEDLPFIRYKPAPEEEDAESIRTMQAWVVDVPEPQHITTLLKWIKQTGLDGPEMGHLKRIRKKRSSTSLVLSTSSEPPELPAELDLPAPYQLPVPTSSALTLPSLNLKSALWPTTYTPRRKDEPEPWTRDKLRWAWNAMKKTVDFAVEARAKNKELPIAAYIPTPYGVDEKDAELSDLSFIASDSRTSTKHPLRHASINTIRKLADYHASIEEPKDGLDPLEVDKTAGDVRNGTNYLLTDRTFFVTHEPCIMCSMSLLHSRAKEVIYLYPMAKTGGCGGCTCLPMLKGVNHRYSIFQWKLDKISRNFTDEDLTLDQTLDA
ncbi:hypothetical protein CPC08DRAFT_683412 [Agrocybe pediades]|nr:hypothetical protein CPC08DRAFT_683412 [Agrocybe pediades]